MDLPDYRPGHLLRALREPRRALLELNKLYRTRVRGETGLDVVAADWDNLLILDACRYDTFAAEHDLPGTLSRAVSRGSQTVQFLEANFGDGDYPELVYVSANPNISLVGARFHERVRLWEDHTDAELGVVPPEPVTDEALAAAARHPDKRLVVHYMQPHFPFVGEFGRSLYDSGRLEHRTDGVEFWRQLSEGRVTEAEFRRAYVENLRVSLPAVRRLVDGLDGRTVVTADHGNEFGRFGVYGHPANTYTRGLVEVPWLVVEGNRREIRPGRATDGPVERTADLTEKLEALGYR